MTDCVIKGNILYSADKDTLISIEHGYLVSINGYSAGVYAELPEQYASLEQIDCKDQLVIPGMVDLHTHAPQYAFRGMGMDMELLDWLNAYAFKEEQKYSDLAYADRAYAVFADALHSGATTRAVVFGTIHRAATVRLMQHLEHSGIISLCGKVNMDRNAPSSYIESTEASIRETERFIADCNGFDRTGPILTPRFIPSCSDALMERLGAIAAANGLPVQSHLSENPAEIEWVHELCPDDPSYGDAYDRHGLFGSCGRCVMAHAVYSSEREIALMKARGVYIAHCPASNMNVGSGIAPIRRYLDDGLRVGLGTDVAGGQSDSIFTAMVEALQVSRLYWRLVDHSRKPLGFSEAFYMATKGGGEFFGKVGSFEEGYEFDCIVLDDSLLPHPQPLTLAERLERAVYLGADRNGIRMKFVRGERIL